jgi:hypothetical protein
MHTHSLNASNPLPPSATRNAENLVYQAVTVAAMLMLLVSVWVF